MTKEPAYTKRRAKLNKLDLKVIVQRAQTGDQDARDELFHRYEPLVQSTARAYTTVEDATQREDYVQEGYLGLLDALRGFDTEKGTAFGAYAKRFVKHRMTAQWARAIGLNDYQHGKFKKVRRQLDAFFNEHGRPPSEEELADAIKAEYDFRPRPSTLRNILRTGKGTVPVYADNPSGDTAQPGFVPTTEAASHQHQAETFDELSTLFEMAHDHLDERRALFFVALHVLHKLLGLEYKAIRQALADSNPLLPCLNLEENPDVPEEGLYWHQHHERLQLPSWLSTSWPEVCGWFEKSNGDLLKASALGKRFTSAAKTLEHYVKMQDF